MVWTIPNTFVGGTPANATEMNENFTSIKQFVDILETQSASNEIDISNLTTNKADINGSTEQRFSVADPSTSMDAINLQTFKSLTLNSRDTIGGFELSKFDNNTINASPGSCYDSTYEYMINSTLTLQKSDTLSANTTYYVYAVADEQSGEVELTFNTSSTTPTLPSGFDYFRQIGSFNTNSSGNIDQVNSYNSLSFPNTKSTNGYIKFPNGIIIQWGRTGDIGRLSVSTITFPIAFSTTCASVSVCPMNWAGSHGDRVGMPWRVANLQSTVFQIYNNNEEYSVNYCWMAVGY